MAFAHAIESSMPCSISAKFWTMMSSLALSSGFFSQSTFTVFKNREAASRSWFTDAYLALSVIYCFDTAQRLPDL